MSEKCWGWRTQYCPNDAVVDVHWSYEGARQWPTSISVCVECFEWVLDFLNELQVPLIELHYRESWRY